MKREFKRRIVELLNEHRIMTIATNREDGWPQATTVGYVSDGLTLYFLCGLDSQKAANLARDDRVSLTIGADTPDLMAIADPLKLARKPLTNGVLTFPFFTIENVDIVDANHIVVGNDNNLPFSSSREPNKADDNELILLEVGEFLKAR